MSGKAIRETLAALGVIASMVFVGLEIRQNTAVARMVAAQTFTQQQLDLNQVIMTEGYPELNTRMIEGALRQDFSSGDRLRLDATNLSVIRIWESLYRSVQLGIQDEEMLKAITDGPTPFELPYFVQSWPMMYRGAFTEDFASYFEELLGLGLG